MRSTPTPFNNLYLYDQKNEFGDILNQIQSKPQSLSKTYRILSDIAQNANYRSANICISFYNQERERCDIKGIKLYGSNSNDKSWIVIMGGREPNQWSTISLSLYLANLFSYQPLENFDILIFPVECPKLYMDTKMTMIQPQQQQLNLQFSNHQQQQLISSNNSSSNNNNANNKINYYPEKKNNNVLNNWLKNSKRNFDHLNLDFNSSTGKPSITTTNNRFSPIQDHQNPLGLFNSNSYNNILEQNELNIGQPKNHNFILEIKDLKIHPNLSFDKILQIGIDFHQELDNFTKNGYQTSIF
eukprot:gene8264-10154_t